MSAKKEKIKLEIIKPAYTVGQEIYIPKRNNVTQTTISGYEVQVIKEGDSLIGVVSNYRLLQGVTLRRGERSDLVFLVKECDFYADKNKAKEASKFIPVTLDDENWRLAIGDRMVTEEDSPYNIDNCGLPCCCTNISDARDILYFCRTENGLIMHERNTLAYLLKNHGFKYDIQSPIGKLLGQLGI